MNYRLAASAEMLYTELPFVDRVRRIHNDRGLPVRPVQAVTPEMWLTAADTLRRVADLGAEAGRVFTLENLNLAVDHPGTPFATAADTRRSSPRSTAHT